MSSMTMAKKYLSRGDARVKSFTSASGLPWKLLQNKGCVVDGAVQVKHVQFSPTNKCDYGRCAWCSCSGVDRSVEMPMAEMLDMVCHFGDLGAKAITVTGGGEPAAYPHLHDLLYSAVAERDIHAGMVTNGLKWCKPSVDIRWVNGLLTWLRISTVDPHGEPKVGRFRSICEKLPNVDVGISFTVPYNVNVAYAEALCRIADSLPNLTHIRFVDNILDPQSVAMDALINRCEGITDKAIFQKRSEWVRGMNPCLISKLKPYVDASGDVFPCCGAQYALLDETSKLPQRMRVCHWSGFRLETSSFDGRICEKCYYQDYNVSLLNMTEPIQHERFV